MELEYIFIGDLLIWVNVCGEIFMLVICFGGGFCNVGVFFGFLVSVNGYFIFLEGGGFNLDNGLVFGGGNYGFFMDFCNVNMVNIFV